MATGISQILARFFSLSYFLPFDFVCNAAPFLSHNAFARLPPKIEALKLLPTIFFMKKGGFAASSGKCETTHVTILCRVPLTTEQQGNTYPTR